MKKNLFFALAALGMLASCSNDETIDVVQPEKPKPINFETFINKATRAETTTSSLQSSGFKVWGSVSNASITGYEQIFDGEAVTYGTGWTHPTARYWQANSNYAFTAIGPKIDTDCPWTFTHGTVSDTDFLTKRHGSIAFNVETAQADCDLVYDFKTVEQGAEIDNATVAFTMNHLLSRVKVQITNGFTANNQYLKITNLRVISAKTGTLNLSNYATTVANDELVWTDLSTTPYAKELSFVATDLNNDGNINKGNAANTGACYILPAQTELKIAFDAQLFTGTQAGPVYKHDDYEVEGTTYEHAAKVTISGGMKPGHSYILKGTVDASNINPGGALNTIEFTATVTGWGADEEGTINF